MSYRRWSDVVCLLVKHIVVSIWPEKIIQFCNQIINGTLFRGINSVIIGIGFNADWIRAAWHYCANWTWASLIYFECIWFCLFNVVKYTKLSAVSFKILTELPFFKQFRYVSIWKMSAYFQHKAKSVAASINPSKLFISFTVRKVSKYGVFSGPNTGKYSAFGHFSCSHLMRVCRKCN